MHRVSPLFVSHGAPTFALRPGLAGAQLGALGRAIDRPRAIAVVSPHWITRGVSVTAAQQPRTIHDFGGFDRALRDIVYPATGNPVLAQRIANVLGSAGWDVWLDPARGLDHGAWVPLLHLYPDADVPVVQISMPHDLDAEAAFELGRALAPLADEGILIIGSGSLTHNLYEFRMEGSADVQYPSEFAAWIRQAVQAGDSEKLLGALEQAPHASRAHPTSEHFLPLLVAFGAARDPLPATVLQGGVEHGVLVMESYVFGSRVHVETLEGVTR